LPPKFGAEVYTLLSSLTRRTQRPRFSLRKLWTSASASSSV
jgi:hypothetical protein